MLATAQNISPLITKINKPKLSTVAGKVRIIRIGRKTALTKTEHHGHHQRGQKLVDGDRVANTSLQTAYITHVGFPKLKRNHQTLVAN